MVDKHRPEFGKRPSVIKSESPEKLYYSLKNREKTHDYLRGPQQDILRGYAEGQVQTADIALELPTGTGKSLVGLMIAEWRRREFGRRAAFLCLTNQLAKQVINEARKLDLAVADLAGASTTRSPAEEGRYRAAEAVGISTYANLFNINPVITENDVLVLDDAHGGETYCAGCWTIDVRRTENEDLYVSLLAVLRPRLTNSQQRMVEEPSRNATVQFCDAWSDPAVVAGVTATLDQVDVGDVSYRWRFLRANLRATLVMVSYWVISIRPLVPPTHTHAPFANARQRVYMTATLGGPGDIQRAYGVQRVEVLRAVNPQEGRRFVFVPEMYTDSGTALRVVAEAWNEIPNHRGVVLSPSERHMKQINTALVGKCEEPCEVLGAESIAASLTPFTGRERAWLSLMRYDGLDLPGDDCRLLVLNESPRAVGALEAAQRDHWKMGPMLRRRERTRLVQGMGRCTRSATDYAVIVLLGQSLVNAVTIPDLMHMFPTELRAEIAWGLVHSRVAEDDADSMIAMIHGLIADKDYRDRAGKDIEEFRKGMVDLPAKGEDPYDTGGREEVRFSHAFWDEDYEAAYKAAREMADGITGAEYDGYRAFWWYLASCAISHVDRARERDCLERAAKCGVNAGWLRFAASQRGVPAIALDALEQQVEAIWDQMEEWGWAGPRFLEWVQKMTSLIAQDTHKQFHEGLELLGKCLGALTDRTGNPGVPDVVWSFPNDFHLAFEAKTEAKADTALSKKRAQQATGHVAWVRSELCGGNQKVEIEPVLVAHGSGVDELARPHLGELLYCSIAQLREFARLTAQSVSALRIKYAGREYASAKQEFASDVRIHGIQLDNVRQNLFGQRLKDLGVQG